MTLRLENNGGKEDKGVSARDIIVRPSRDDDVAAMLAIYLHHIRHGVDLRNITTSNRPTPTTSSVGAKTCKSTNCRISSPKSPEWVVGYAYAVPFRKRPAYRYVVKHSIYVHHEHLHPALGDCCCQR